MSARTPDRDFDYRSMSAALKAGKIPTLLLLCGDEDYLIRHLLKMLKEAVLVPGAESLDALHFESFPEEEKLLSELRTPAFLSERKFILIKDSGLFSAKGNKEEKMARLEKVLPALNEHSCLVFWESQTDRRQKTLFDRFLEAGSICRVERESDDHLRSWIGTRLRREEIRISREAADSLIQRCDGAMEDLLHEMAKIKDYCLYTGVRQVNLTLVDHCCREDLAARIFDLLGAMASQRPEQSLLLLDRMLKNREAPTLIHFMLGRQFRQLLCAKGGAGKRDLVQKLKIRDFAAERLLCQAKGFTESRLRRLCRLAFDLDRKVKSGEIQDRMALELMILEGACSCETDDEPA